MKRIPIVILVALLAIAGIAIFRHHGSSPTETGAVKTMYQCPMHPSVTSDKPGDCPICGMKLVPMEQAAATNAPAPAEPPVSGLAPVTMTAADAEKMGLTFGTVERRELARDVRTSASIAPDESRLVRVNTKVAGWVDKLFVSVTGQSVSKGDPLLTIYSPDLVASEQEYLTALKTAKESGLEGLAAAALRRLEYWDISPEQIERLEKTREVEKTLTMYAPADGVVLEKDVVAGQRIEPGAPIMTIADLSEVWANIDVYESDLPHVALGMPAEVSLPYWPDESFAGQVAFLSPTVDPETRTLRARLDLPNPKLLLKPGMFGDARLHYSLGDRLAIPDGAVMRTGARTYAFRDDGGGTLTPVAIEVGARSDGWYELVAGLNEGDRVVTSANFLVDSESSMQSAVRAATK